MNSDEKGGGNGASSSVRALMVTFATLTMASPLPSNSRRYLPGNTTRRPSQPVSARSSSRIVKFSVCYSTRTQSLMISNRCPCPRFNKGNAKQLSDLARAGTHFGPRGENGSAVECTELLGRQVGVQLRLGRLLGHKLKHPRKYQDHLCCWN